MAQDEDRRWRERMRRDDDNRSSYSSSHQGDHRGGGRGWSEGSEWRDRNRGEHSSGSFGSGGYGSRESSFGDRERWGGQSGSDWDQSGWRDMDQGRDWSQRQSGGRRDMRQGGWGSGEQGHDYRQDRDFAGSMRAGESGSYTGGARYGTGGYGGRSGMGFGGSSGGYSGRSSGSQSWGGREYGQYSGMTSEPGYGSSQGSSYGSGMSRGGEQGYGYGGPHDWSGDRNRGDERGFWDKASDEVSSWFGDEDAEHRREMDRRHSGRGPRNYARSDSRINEDVCDRLTDNPMVDASDIEVAVSEREVTLTGSVRSRDEKRRAEDIAEAVSGVTHVQNNLRVKQQGSDTGSSMQRTLDSLSNATEGAFGEHGGSTMSSRTTPGAGSGSGSGATGATSASATGASGGAKTTTGSSPGVMRTDPSTSTTRGA